MVLKPKNCVFWFTTGNTTPLVNEISTPHHPNNTDFGDLRGSCLEHHLLFPPLSFDSCTFKCWEKKNGEEFGEKKLSYKIRPACKRAILVHGAKLACALQLRPGGPNPAPTFQDEGNV